MIEARHCDLADVGDANDLFAVAFEFIFNICVSPLSAGVRRGLLLHSNVRGDG